MSELIGEIIYAFIFIAFFVICSKENIIEKIFTSVLMIVLVTIAIPWIHFINWLSKLIFLNL